MSDVYFKIIEGTIRRLKEKEEKILEPPKKWVNVYCSKQDGAMVHGRRVSLGTYMTSQEVLQFKGPNRGIYPSKDIAETCAKECFEKPESINVSWEYLGARPL